MSSFMVLDDGIIQWYDGPEWDEVAEQAFQEAGLEVQSYAQANAVWEDRTGDARAELNTEVTNEGGGDITMSLQHGVEYGYWLEVIQNGRFGIIMRTLEEYAPRVISHTINRILAARQGDN